MVAVGTDPARECAGFALRAPVSTSEIPDRLRCCCHDLSTPAPLKAKCRPFGTFLAAVGFAECRTQRCSRSPLEEASMHGLIYLIGLIVVIMFILSFLGLR
jgi:hypothetical protein